jgi:hypothetical protein
MTNLVNATSIFKTAGCTAAPESVMSNFCGKVYIRFKIDIWLRGKRAGEGGFFSQERIYQFTVMELGVLCAQLGSYNGYSMAETNRVGLRLLITQDSETNNAAKRS